MNLLELWERKREIENIRYEKQKITQKQAAAEKAELKRLQRVNPGKTYKEYLEDHKTTVDNLAPVGARPKLSGKGDSWRYRGKIEEGNALVRKRSKTKKEYHCNRCTKLIGLSARRLQKNKKIMYCSECIELLMKGK